ncbi:MAG: B12-binding domain-containing radical SAM protein, partial [Planctomycetes bacterium]|nr:B12-binding domain-containing radical SAM protein [Planctomycetota bacterium]
GRAGRPFNAWIRHWPLLGPITLATILDRKGYDAAVYNENISGPLPEHSEAFEDVCSADVIGITIMTPTANRGYALARRIRRENPRATIAFGGVHATFMPEEAIAYGDLVVQGEGENVIEDIAAGRLKQGIVRAEPPADLDAIPALDHWLMRDFELLMAGSRRRELYELPIATSRGCPHGCVYCSVTRMFGRKCRRQSVEKVYRDVAAYVKQGFRRFFFYDDNFVTDRAWAKDLLTRLADMRIRFNAQVRVDLHWVDRHRRRRDDELLRAMHRGGADVLYIGYETIDQATAKAWNKGYRGSGSLASRLREDTRILHDHRLWVHGMFIMGPESTPKSGDKIVDFARNCGIESIQISALTPLPGTPMMERIRPHLLFTDFPGDWDFYDGAHCLYTHGRMDIPTFHRALIGAHRKFYAWGGWSVRRLRALLSERMGTIDKIVHVWNNAKRARWTLKQWRKETAEFLELAAARAARRASKAASQPSPLQTAAAAT